MSMFHELMMRKKEETMYATIKGTLTENDGVFSGFSATSYLTLQQQVSVGQDTKLDIVVKIKSSQLNESSAFLGTMDSIGLAFRISGAGKLTFYLGNGSNWIVSGLAGTTTLSANTDYYARVKIDNGVITTYISTDGTTWTQEATTTVTFSQTYNYEISLGTGRLSTTYFVGSIDLPNSYIKLGSTKYKLQAVVGYTVVGSPTITDGVVSGFTTSDYVNVTNMPLENNYEINIPFNYSTVQNQAIFSFGGGNISCLRLTNAGKIIFYLLFNYTLANAVVLTSDKIVYANTDYIIKLKGNNGIHQMLLSSDNGASWELLDTKEYNFTIPSNTFNFGVATSLYNIGFGGSINMNNTYIKINNKLWFNGQQA